MDDQLVDVLLEAWKPFLLHRLDAGHAPPGSPPVGAVLEKLLADEWLRDTCRSAFVDGNERARRGLRRELADLLEAEDPELRRTVEKSLAHASAPGAAATVDGIAVGRIDQAHFHAAPPPADAGDPDAGGLEDPEQRYLRRLLADTSDIPLRGLDRAAKVQTSTRVALRTVYTALLTTHTDPIEEDARKGDPPDWERRPASALELLDRHPLLVLLGGPGSGKSTFVNFLCQCLAGERLGRDDVSLRLLTSPLPRDEDAQGEDEPPQTWSHGALLPLRVVLRDFAASGAADGTAEGFWSFVESTLSDQRLADTSPTLERILSEEGLLLLDGLDEVPETARARKRVLDSALSFARSAGCRVLVTSRIHPYENQDWSVPGGFETRLAPFTRGQIRRFIHLWYEDVVSRRPGDFAEPLATRAGRLERAVLTDQRLYELAERPLLLTLMAAIHAWKGTLPEDREQLYHEIVDLLLEVWDQQRFAQGLDGELKLEHPALSAWLGADRPRIRRELERLAFEVHDAQPELAGTADVDQDVLLGRLSLLRQECDVHDLEEFLRERSGLLVRRGDSTYTFPHRSFQEYLAACHLTDVGWHKIVEPARRDPDRWREVVLLAAAKLGRGGRAQVWDVVGRFCTGKPEDDLGDDASKWGAQIAGQMLVESVASKAPLDGLETADRETLERVIEWLRALMGSDLPPVERHLAGKNLGILGDPRFDPDRGYLPRKDLGFLRIPAGPFLFGSRPEEDPRAYDDEQPQSQVDLGEYWISRWPVTIAQFGAFLEAIEADPPHPRTLDGPKHAPVVHVSCSEAEEYCRWLTERLKEWSAQAEVTWPDKVSREIEAGRWGIRLPTEQEWEKAARGTKGLIYPWGNEYREGLCNDFRAGIREPSVLGCFPLGRSVSHGEDMSGNVDEWTLSKWTDSHSRQASKESQLDHGFVIRGGFHGGGRRHVRCAYRLGVPPQDPKYYIGFRVALAPFSIL